MNITDATGCPPRFAYVDRNEGLRDQIALHALAGFIAAGRGYTIEQIAEAAYQLADAMLAERAK